MRLEAFLIELLYHHDCVIVPGFGGLVANYRSARLNKSSHIIHPPSKHVGFNRHLVQNDGLLVNHMSSVLGIGYKEASAQLDEHVGGLKRELASNGRIAWEKIGVFFNDSSGALQFIPEDQENFLLQSFGFTAIQLRPLVKQMPLPVEETEESPTVVVHPASTAASHTWKIAAAIAVPVLLASAWLLSSTNVTKGFDLANMNPFATQEITSSYRMLSREDHVIDPIVESTGWQRALEELPQADRIAFDFVKDQISDLGIQVIVKSDVAVTPDNTTTVYDRPVTTAPVASKGYEVIGGAFAVEENATNLVKELQAQGFDAYMAGKKGPLHLVSFGNFASQKEATDALREIKSKGKSAWIKRKK
jgi:nucleoid DNA-binding protein